jgi:hypothetical protein
MQTLEESLASISYLNNFHLKSADSTLSLEPVNFSLPVPQQDEPDMAAYCVSLNKFTCRFEAQIPYDNGFKVARKIIGNKGQHMKRIVKQCKFLGAIDGLKLRLRGCGSGFKEGPKQKESNDTLHLCLSSSDLEVYRYGCELVENLLKKIYRDYKKFTEGNTSLNVLKSENYPASLASAMHQFPGV